MRVHKEMIDVINSFAAKLVKSLQKIQTADKMTPFKGEQIRQRVRIDYMKDRFLELQRTIDMIEATQPNLRAKVVRQVEEKVRTLEQEMIAKDKEIKKVNARLQRAITETVDVIPLSSRIFAKYVKKLEQEQYYWIDNPMKPKS